MPAGLEIKTVDNFIQIDSEFRNWALVKKGTFYTRVGDSEIYSGPRTIVTVTGVNPLIAVRCDPKCAVRVIRERSGNTFTYYFHHARSPGNIHFNVYYWIFDAPTAEGNVGMQIFNSTKQLVFDASREYMRVVGQVSYSAVFPIHTYKYKEFTYPSSSLAVVTCQQAFKLDYFGSQYPEIDKSTVLSTISGNTLTLVDGPEYTIAGSSTYYPTRRQHSILVIDVRNM